MYMYTCIIMSVTDTIIITTNTHTQQMKHTHTLQLEQMDLELHDASTDVRPALIRRVENYKRELSRLRKEFVSEYASTCTCTCIVMPIWLKFIYTK